MFELSDEQTQQVEAGKALLEQLRRGRAVTYTHGWSDASDTLYNPALHETIVGMRHSDFEVVEELNETMPRSMRIDFNPGLDTEYCAYAKKSIA